MGAELMADIIRSGKAQCEQVGNVILPQFFMLNQANGQVDQDGVAMGSSLE